MTRSADLTSPTPNPSRKGEGSGEQEHAMKVGFIGLGRMGEVMTRRLLDAGHEVGVYNRSAGKAKPLVDAGARR